MYSNLGTTIKIVFTESTDTAKKYQEGLISTLEQFLNDQMGLSSNDVIEELLQKE